MLTLQFQKNYVIVQRYLWYAAAAEPVSAPLDDVDLARPHMRQPLRQLLRPGEAQAGRHNHQQGPPVLQQKSAQCSVTFIRSA